MFKRVLADAGQGMDEKDFERIGAFPQRGMEMLTRDHLTTKLVYSGFSVIKTQSASVQISPGRIMKDGAMYALENIQERSVAEWIPTTAGHAVICLVIGQGQEQSDNSEARYYERDIDPNDPDAGTQRSLEEGYRVKFRQAQITIHPGQESPRPIAPTAPIGTVAIAEILITTSGVQSITMRVDTRAPRLSEVAGEQGALWEELKFIGEAVNGLRADFAGVKANLLQTAGQNALSALQADVALLKDTLDVPDDGSPYWADHFLDYGEVDYNPVTSTGHQDFNCRIEEGIRFPYFNVAEFALAPYNVNDPNLMHVNEGLICLKYDNVEGISVTAASGETALGGVSVVSPKVEYLTESRTRIRYGEEFTVCNNSRFWQGGKYDPIAGIFTARTGETYRVGAEFRAWSLAGSVNHQFLRLRRFWQDTINVPYEKYTAHSETLSGVIKAQTFLLHQERQTARSWLGIKRWGAGASITRLLVECRDDGLPDLSRVLAKSTKNADAFKVWPERSYFENSKPIQLTPLASTSGRARPYAEVWLTTGDIDVATASGQTHLGGNLVATTDGIAWDINLMQDICYGVDFCDYAITDMPIRLASWNLGGGIEDIDILAPILQSQSANTVFKINVGGIWQALGAENAATNIIDGTQAIYEVQVVFTGTRWGMPIVNMGDSRVRLSRNKDVLTCVTSEWALGESANQITLDIVIGNFDATRHELNASVLLGAHFTTEIAAGSPTISPVPGRENDKLDESKASKLTFTFDVSQASPDKIKFKLEGSTDNYRIGYHVEKAMARKSG